MSIKEEFNKKKKLFDIFRVFFCLLQLIGVQTNIIILNSLFSEIVEELKLWISNTHRSYNFYERLIIYSYKEVPEIDVGMITSSIGIMFLKSFGFYCSSITFQLVSSILFFCIFFTF